MCVRCAPTLSSLLLFVGCDAAPRDAGSPLIAVSRRGSCVTCTPLSPLSAAALNAVARQRSGLASSVANTTRQTGTVIGIALLGALVQTRAVASASASLYALPASVAGPLAGLLGHGGPQAPLPATLPVGYSAAQFHQIAASAYIDGIHGSYAVGGIVLLLAAAIAAVALRPAHSAAPAASADVASAEVVSADRVAPAVAVEASAVSE